MLRTPMGPSSLREGFRILDVLTSAAQTAIHERQSFPSARWNEWTIAAVDDGVPHRVIVGIHEDSLRRTGLVEDDGPETAAILRIARMALEAPTDNVMSVATAHSIDTTLEAALMRRMVDPDLAEPFDVIWSGRTQLGPSMLTAQTTFLDAVCASDVEGLPIGRIRIRIEQDDEFERTIHTLRITPEQNLVCVGRIDSMERLRIELEAASRMETTT